MGLGVEGRRWVLGVVQSSVGVVIVLALLPVVMPVLVVLWVWRSLVVVLVWAEYGRVARVASGMEALFALDSAGARSVISGVAVLRGRVSVGTVRAQLAEKLINAKDEKGRLKHPKFHQVVARRCGVVVWLWEDNFTVEGHVHPLHWGHHASLLQDEEDLVSVMAQRTNQPFVRGQAKWEVLVAPLRQFRGDEGEKLGHTAVMVRIHHALGDGRSLVGLIVSALVEPPLKDPRPSPVIQNPWGYRMARAARLAWSLTHLPWVVVRVMVRGDASVLHGPRLEGDKFIGWSPPLSLQALKRARSLAGVSVNDILLTGLAAALHKYFRMEGEDEEVPPQVLTVIPVDVTKPGTPISLANRISLCTVALPTGPMTPKERLTVVHGRLNTLKTSPDIMVNYVALNLISNLLPAPLARRALHTHGVTMVTSNMPGPQEQIQLFHRPVEDLMFFIPNKSRTGLGVSILSYRGVVRAGINVDSALIHNAEFAQELMDSMALEVENVLRELSSSGESICQVAMEDNDASTISGHGLSHSGSNDHTLSHSTDEYDGFRKFSLRSTIDSIKFMDLEAGDSDSEGQHLLAADVNNDNLEIRTVFKSDDNLKQDKNMAEDETILTYSDTNLQTLE